MSKITIKRTIAVLLMAAAVLGCTSCGKSKQQDEYKRAGIEAMDEKEYKKALNSFNKALSLSVTVGPEEKDIALYKASAQHNLGKDGEAINTLDGLLSFDKSDYKALFLKGCIYCDLGKNDKALKTLKNACRTSKKSSLYENAYQTLISSDMTDEAEDFYESMPREARASKKVLRLRVISFEEKSDYADALDSAEKYLAQFPDDEDMTKERDFLKLINQ